MPALAEGDRPTLLLVPEGVAPGAIEGFAGEAPGAAPVRRGNLRIARIPFVSQDDYDRLLRLADLNFVRGEDSWIRAHWARRSFVWQPYRQEEFAHRVKLAAFLERLRAAALAPPSCEAAAVGAIEAMMRAWSGDGDPARAWRDLERQAEAAAVAFRRWTDSLLAQPDLASRLARWAADRL